MFDDSRKPVREAKHSRRKIVARYDYTNENGALLNQKTRWVEDGKKAFTWSHREGGQWIKGRKGEPTLYNLPVIKGAGCVYVVEGEKDVETLKALHIPAVCGADGAGPGKWLSQYTEALRGTPLVLPASPAHLSPAWHLYVLQSGQRERILARLTEEGIATGVYYPVPVPLQPACAALGAKPGDFPVAEALSERCFAIPLFPELTDSEVEWVADCVRRAALEEDPG